MSDCHNLKIWGFHIPEFKGLRMNELAKYRSFEVIRLFSNDDFNIIFENATSSEFKDFDNRDLVVLSVIQMNQMHQSNFICSRIDNLGMVEFLRPNANPHIVTKVSFPGYCFGYAEKDGIQFKVGDYYRIELNRASEDEVNQIKKREDEWWDD